MATGALSTSGASGWMESVRFGWRGAVTTSSSSSPESSAEAPVAGDDPFKAFLAREYASGNYALT